MYYRQKIAPCFAASPAVAEREFYGLLRQQIRAAVARLRREKAEGALPLLSITETDQGIAAIDERAEYIRARCNQLVILGTGGSSLCGQALTGLLGARRAAGTPSLHFACNVDPDGLAALLDSVDIDKAHFLAVSKSGTTLETMAQLGHVLALLAEKLGKEKIRERVTIITDPADNPLRRTGAYFGIPVMDHEPGIGGRFSIFTNVALLPALVAGLDITAFRRGAAEIIRRSLDPDAVEASEPAAGAALHLLMMKHGVNIAVMMPYIERLQNFTTWHRQIWSESLGKSGHGSTPVRAIGTLDQHSQLQLYLDGPRDKFFTLFTLARHAGDTSLLDPEFLPDRSQVYLYGKTLGQVLDASARATLDTMIHRRLPVRHFELDKLDEETMGALIMHFMLETIIAAYVMDVDPFDQPAVEDGKIRARKLLEQGAFS